MSVECSNKHVFLTGVCGWIGGQLAQWQMLLQAGVQLDLAPLCRSSSGLFHMGSVGTQTEEAALPKGTKKRTETHDASKGLGLKLA